VVNVQDNTKTDLVLIQQTLAGDESAFANIIDKYKNGIMNTVYCMLNNTHDAEDITQEAFIKAYHNLGTYRVTYQFSTWLYNIAINLARNKIKQRKFMFFSINSIQITDTGSYTPDSLIDNQNMPDKEYEKKEQRAIIDKMLLTLPMNQREVVVLRYLENFSYEEIAGITGRPLGTVKILLHRARHRLYKNFRTQST